MEQGRPGRKGCGRRRIEIKKIENQRKRWVAFSKRKKGLLSKADRLSRMSGEDIGIVIISEQGRIYTSDNADAVIRRYLPMDKDNKEKNVEPGKERLENRCQQEASTSASKRLRRSDCHKDDAAATVAADAAAVTRRYRPPRIVKERKTLSLLCKLEDSSTCLHDNKEDAASVKRSTDDGDDDDVAGTHDHRSGRIVKECDDHDNGNETTISKFKSLCLEHEQRTLPTTTDNGGGGGYNGYEDTDADDGRYENGRAVEEDVIQLIDFFKMKDEEIKRENSLFDLNKIPDDES